MHPENSFRISPGIQEIEYKKGFFSLWAAGVLRGARICSGSMPVLTGPVAHAGAVAPTLPEPEAAFNQRESRETFLPLTGARLRLWSPGRSLILG